MSKDVLPGGVIRWEKPPPYVQPISDQSSRTNWQLISAQLRSEPGEWAVIAEGPKAGQTQSRINGGTVVYWQPKGSFKAVVRRVGGVKTMYAVYVGEPTSQQPAVADRAAVDGGDDDPGAGVGGVDHLAAAERDGDVP